MKKLLPKILTVGIVALTLAPLLSLAQAVPTIPNQPLDYGRVIGIIDNIANILFGILVAISVFFVLWAAWLYLGAQDPDKAKTMLIWTAVAIAVALLAKMLPRVVYILVGITPSGI